MTGTEMQVHVLIRVDTRTISDADQEIRAFMNVRNEMLRLPQTLDHYRKIGVARFFITDNGSTDGSREFLLAQPDCHVFVTTDSYSAAVFGLEWQHALLNEYGLNRWCLTVDADEWFIYPGYERKTLSDLAAYLDRTGAQGVFSFLLDMYGPGRIDEENAKPGQSLLDVCRYFDSEYKWRRKFYFRGVEQPRFPEYTIVGGPRLRLLLPFLLRYEYLLRIVWRISHVVKLRLPVTLRPAPILTKIPFVRWLPGTRYQHPHATIPIKLADVTGVLLHFKFLQDFAERVKTEVDRKEHWDAASEYARYLARLKCNPSVSFYYSGSLAYEGSDQLIRLGLLREDKGWREMRTARNDPTSGGEV